MVSVLFEINKSEPGEVEKDDVAIPLTDRVQIKNELKAKLLREVEGFRTSGTQFTSVTKLDHSDLLKIVKQIKKKLGN